MTQAGCPAFRDWAMVPLRVMVGYGFVSMVVAMLTVHLRYGFSSINTIGMSPAGPLFGPPGYEINLLYITALIVLAVGGAGRISFDDWWTRRRRRAPIIGNAS